ncbi:AI-2E family transporter, partial [Neisseria dentiae]
MYRKKTRGGKPWLIAAAVAAVFVWLVYALGNILTPFIVAAVLAYILNPLVEKLRDKGMKRGLAAMVVMILSLAVIFALVLIIVPMLINQFNNLVDRLPQIVGFVQNKLLPWVSRLAGERVEIDVQSVTAWLQSHTGELSNALRKAAPTLLRQGGNVAAGLSNLLLLPFLLYYFLLDWQRWSHGVR